MDKPCKETELSKDYKGYGRIKRYDRYGIRHQLEHRWVYAIAHDYKFEEGEVVRHLCNNPGCIEITHLALGSYQDNTNDAIKAGRHIKGSRVGGAILTEFEVLDIKNLLDKGKLSHQEIADLYEVKRHCIADISSGRTWKHVK